MPGLPAALDPQQGGTSSGSFTVVVPSNAKERAECERDVSRTLLAGSISVLTPSSFEEVCRRPDRKSSLTGEVEESGSGDVSNNSVRETIADFREQILKATEKTIAHPALTAKLEDIVLGILSNLTIGPALDFTIKVGLPPRMLHPRFIIVAAPQSLRIATLGFVGDPLVGNQPSEQRTPFLARLLTQNLLDLSAGAMAVHFRVRQVGAVESNITACVSTERPTLLDAAENPDFCGKVSSPPLIAGVEIPADNMQENDDTTFFGVRVKPADGGEPWTIQRRYRDFLELYSLIAPDSGHLAASSFPRKHMFACTGKKLQSRREGLEMWLSEIVKEAHAGQPGWLEPLSNFLEVTSRGASASAAAADMGGGASPSGLASGKSEMFQSCDDLTALAPDMSRPERLVQELGLTLRTLRQMQLPAGGDAACERVAAELDHLEDVLMGRTAAVPSSPSKDQSPAPTKKLQNIVRAVGMQKSLGNAIQPGSLASGLNQMISLLWPRIGTFVKDLIQNSIEPTINDSLPGMLKGGVKFTRVELGQSSPLLGPIVVEHDEKTGAIEMHIGIDFTSDLDIELTAMAIPIGITRIFLKGDLVLLFTPPMMAPPFFGGVQVYFPNPPDVGLNFVGAAKVANVPGLRGAIRGAIDGAVAGVCVLPRRIAVDMNEEDDVDIIDLTYPEPIGILRFTLWSAAGLVASDVSLFGTATSDPYVVASLGIKTWTSPHISKTLNPEWGNGEGLTVDFPVHDNCQELFLKILDYDFGSADDLIGMTKSGGVRDLVAAGPQKQTLQLLKSEGETGGGSITISAVLLTFASARPAAPLAMSGPSEAHLSAKVFSIIGLKDGAEYPFKVRVQLVKTDLGEAEASSETKAAGYKARKAQSSFSAVASAASGMLKASKSMALGSASKTQILAEGVTAASHPKEQKHLAEALQGIAKQLAEKGLQTDEVAEILDVGPAQVDQFLTSMDVAKSKEQQEAQDKFLNVRDPLFEEVVQFLLPCGSVDSLSILELSVVDKREKVLAMASVPLPTLLDSPALSLDGPFTTDTPGVEIVGSLRLRWLA